MQLNSPEKEKLLTQFREFFITTYHSRSDPQQIRSEIETILNGALLKFGFFEDNITAIIDNSTHRYLYMSGFSEHWPWFNREQALKLGVNYTLQFIPEHQIKLLLQAIKELTEHILKTPVSDRLHIRFNYNLSVVYENQSFRLFQQTIPLTLTDSGLPHLIFVTTSNISDLTKDDRMSYKVTLNLPNQPIKLLLVGGSEAVMSSLTNREKEIVHHLGEGLDANDIAEKLFISEGTVRTHRKNILEKTGAKNSVHLVRMAVANGWM